MENDYELKKVEKLIAIMTLVEIKKTAFVVFKNY